MCCQALVQVQVGAGAVGGRGVISREEDDAVVGCCGICDDGCWVGDGDGDEDEDGIVFDCGRWRWYGLSTELMIGKWDSWFEKRRASGEGEKVHRCYFGHRVVPSCSSSLPQSMPFENHDFSLRYPSQNYSLCTSSKCKRTGTAFQSSKIPRPHLTMVARSSKLCFSSYSRAPITHSSS